MSRYTNFHCPACGWTGWEHVNAKDCPLCGRKLSRGEPDAGTGPAPLRDLVTNWRRVEKLNRETVEGINGSGKGWLRVARERAKVAQARADVLAECARQLEQVLGEVAQQ